MSLPVPQLINFPYKFPPGHGIVWAPTQPTSSSSLMSYLYPVTPTTSGCLGWKPVAVNLESSLHLFFGNEKLVLLEATHRLISQLVSDFFWVSTENKHSGHCGKRPGEAKLQSLILRCLQSSGHATSHVVSEDPCEGVSLWINNQAHLALVLDVVLWFNWS